MNIYIPTQQDYEHFMYFYGCGPGAPYSNPKLHSATFQEFADACRDHQLGRTKVPWDFGFSSMERELVRDQLLHNRGHDIIGYSLRLYHPRGDGSEKDLKAKYRGLEHLRPKTFNSPH
jgi:hypothetical protein